jgi:phage terminase large subunit-like protein
MIQSWDFTFKDSKGSDFVVGQVWGRVGSNKYLLDQVRGKFSFTASLTAMRSMT